MPNIPQGTNRQIAEAFHRVRNIVEGGAIADKSKNLDIGFYKVNDASLQIVFGTHSGDSLPATMHFCVPSTAREINGNFTVPLN